MDLGETAHHEPPYLDQHCMQIYGVQDIALTTCRTLNQL